MKKSVLISAVILLAIVFILSLGLYIYLSRRSAQEPAPTETPTAAITPEVPTAEEPTQASEPVVETPPVEETMEPTPEVQQEPDHSQRAGEILSEMTLTQKICQMMIIDVSSYNGNYPVGGVVFFQADIQSREQVTQDISNIQQSGLLGLFVCVDEEGGTVTRTGNIPDIPSSTTGIRARMWRMTTQKP